MSDQHQVPAGSSGWLSPTAAGIAGLTIATISLLSNGAWLFVVQGWLNRNGASAYSDGVMLTGVAQGIMAAAALFLARRALAGRLSVARDLGGAAVSVGGLALLVAVLTLLVGMAGNH